MGGYHEAYEEVYTKGRGWNRPSLENAPPLNLREPPSWPEVAQAPVPTLTSTAETQVPVPPVPPAATSPAQPQRVAPVTPVMPTSLAELVGSYIVLDGEFVRTGDNESRLQADADSKKCRLFLAWCVQSHHRDRLPGLPEPRPAQVPGRRRKKDRASIDRSELNKGIARATKDQVTVVGRSHDGARLSRPVFLDEALLKLARCVFGHLDAETIGAASATARLRGSLGSAPQVP